MNFNIDFLDGFTPDQENFYKQIGWSKIEKAQDLGRDVFLMSVEI